MASTDVHAKGEDGMTPLHVVAKFKPRKDRGDDEAVSKRQRGCYNVVLEIENFKVKLES